MEAVDGDYSRWCLRGHSNGKRLRFCKLVASHCSVHGSVAGVLSVGDLFEPSAVVRSSTGAPACIPFEARKRLDRAVDCFQCCPSIDEVSPSLPIRVHIGSSDHWTEPPSFFQVSPGKTSLLRRTCWCSLVYHLVDASHRNAVTPAAQNKSTQSTAFGKRFQHNGIGQCDFNNGL